MIAQAGGPVLLVGHSYGGAVITGAGAAPNVVGLVYIAAFAPDAGESLGRSSEAAPPPAGAQRRPRQRRLRLDRSHEVRRELLPGSAGRRAASHGRHPEGAGGQTFGDRMEVPAWRSRPSWYQISSEDRMIHPDNQRRMSGRLGAKKVVTLAAGHASLASKPAEVSALIDEAAKATSG